MGTNIDKPLSSEIDNPESIPYFLWDEPMTVAEFRRRLQTASRSERVRLLAKLMREARDTDVWKFTSPAEISQKWAVVASHLGRRRDFWEFLLNRWRQEGLIGN
ncbi:MAG: hypothetical protein J2P41_04265 [Blastocatellia bacterium]|nr:hypothetical protein [Blastocatellia bacterium]